MAIDLVIPLSDVNSVIGTAANQFNTMRLYRASSRGGTYALVTTITLVASTTRYEYSDTSGLTSSWYKVTLYNSVTTTETALAEAEPFPAARDITTRKELRQKVIKNLGGDPFTLTALAAQSATVTEALDTGDDADAFVGYHLYRPDSASAADNDRRVTAEAAGVLTHGGAAYSDTTVGSETVELMPIDISFSTLNEKIGDGLRNTRWLYRYEFGTESGTKQYSLPNFVEGEEYVVDGWLRFGQTASAYTWDKLEGAGKWWRVHGSNFQCVLNISPSQGDNAVVALDVWRAGEPLDSETDFTIVHPQWAEAAAMVSVIEHLITRDVVRHATSVYAPLLDIWTKKLRQYSRKHGPTPGLRVKIPTPGFIGSFPSV